MTYEELRQALSAADDKECGVGCTPDEVTEAESALGVSFPADYTRFLEDFGWLAIGSTEIFGLGKGVPDYLNVVRMTLAERRDTQPTIPSQLVPVMNDGGGNLYCVDCEATSDEVVIWDHTKGRVALRTGFADWLASIIAA